MGWAPARGTVLIASTRMIVCAPAQEAAHDPLIEGAYAFSSRVLADAHMIGNHARLIFFV